MKRLGVSLLCLTITAAAGCSDRVVSSAEDDAAGLRAPELPVLDSRLVAEGREIFRYDDFGDWRFWTDTARLHELVETVTPNGALALGLKVDVEAIPPEVLQAVADDPTLLENPAITRALLSLDAVVGLKAQVEGDRIVRIGTTCALCHSSVDNPSGIGVRQDGFANRDLAIGTILSLLPGLPTIAASLGVPEDALRAEFESWRPGFYDARVNLDGQLAAPPVVIPPAYGLRGVGLETYTGEGPVSYWNAYVAVTQMHGRGSFFDPKLGVRISVPASEDEVTRKLPALRQYQYSLAPPPPSAGSFNAAAALRGRAVFEGPAACTRCHAGKLLTDRGNLHAPEETDMEPTWAQRGTTGMYRTTPLRGLWQHPPYFHDGSAERLEDVVDHYDDVFGLNLSAQQRGDLVEYLKSL